MSTLLAWWLILSLVSAKLTIVTAGHEPWVNNSRWIKGDKIAFLHSRPRKPGDWVMREYLPSHASSGVHFHNRGEANTVLSGTLYMGFGDKVDASHVVALPPGSYIYVPAGVHHYAITKDSSVLLEERGEGLFHSTRVAKGSAHHSSDAKPIIVIAGREQWKPQRRFAESTMLLRRGPTGDHEWRENIRANYISPVHLHRVGEATTVLSGREWLGVGDTRDLRHATLLGPGSFVYIPAGLHHYVITGSQPVVVQGSATGTLRTVFIPARGNSRFK